MVEKRKERVLLGMCYPVDVHHISLGANLFENSLPPEIIPTRDEGALEAF